MHTDTTCANTAQQLELHQSHSPVLLSRPHHSQSVFSVLSLHSVGTPSLRYLDPASRSSRRTITHVASRIEASLNVVLVTPTDVASFAPRWAAYVMASVVLSCPCFGHIQGYVVIGRCLMPTLLVLLQKKVI